ncbi:MAG: MFS transporter, partial [Paracoccaceae bacterium]|nr:MFS transporter [Paracoccaceae bacterium]
MPGKIRSMTFLLIATSTGMSLWFMVAAVLPDMAAEAGVPETALALLSSAVQAGFVIGALFIAISGIADRLDPRHLLAFCAVSTSLATLALLLVEIGGTTAVALRFLTGALMAGVYPVGMKLAVGWGTRDRGFL